MKGHKIINAKPIGKYYSFKLTSENRFYSVILPPHFDRISIINVLSNKSLNNDHNTLPDVTFILGDGINSVSSIARMNKGLNTYQWVDIEAAQNVKGVNINTAEYFIVHCANLRHYSDLKILIEIEIEYDEIY